MKLPAGAVASTDCEHFGCCGWASNPRGRYGEPGAARYAAAAGMGACSVGEAPAHPCTALKLEFGAGLQASGTSLDDESGH